MREKIIPVFLPNAGCRSRCSFCNQQAVEANHCETDVSAVEAEISKWLPRFGVAPYLAFYGGTFTSLPEHEQSALLAVAADYIRRGLLAGVRLSTRPDAVDWQKACQLADSHVSVVEIGAQSLDDAVLEANNRRHSAGDVVSSVSLLRRAGIKTGIHLMTGLYADNEQRFMRTVAVLRELRPDYLRIHPTLVLRDTQLESLLKSGSYAPQSIPEAIAQCAWLKACAWKENIKVIRTGLQASDILPEQIVAGPWHPAFGELTDSLCYYTTLKAKVAPKPDIQVSLHPADMSKACGQRKMIQSLLARSGVPVDYSTDERLNRSEMKFGGIIVNVYDFVADGSYEILKKNAEELFEKQRI